MLIGVTIVESSTEKKMQIESGDIKSSIKKKMWIDSGNIISSMISSIGKKIFSKLLLMSKCVVRSRKESLSS